MVETDLDKIRHAIECADVEEARDLLRDALRDPSADIYYLASRVALNDAQKVQFLEKALELDPFHQQAADALGSNMSTSEQGILVQAGRKRTGAEGLSNPTSGTRPDGRALPGYDKKRMAPLMALGMIGGAAMALLPAADEQIAAILGILIAAAYVVTIAVLIVQHRRSLLKPKRWLYLLEIAVLFVTVFFTSVILLFIRTRHVSDGLLLFLVIAGGAWAFFAIVGSGVLCPSRRNNG